MNKIITDIDCKRLFPKVIIDSARTKIKTINRIMEIMRVITKIMLLIKITDLCKDYQNDGVQTRFASLNFEIQR